MLDTKLQLKFGQTITFLNAPLKLPTKAKQVKQEICDVLVVFVVKEMELKKQTKLLLSAAKQGKILWVAYPKAGQLGADINRDSIHKAMLDAGLKTVRQISIDDVWSALRLKLS